MVNCRNNLELNISLFNKVYNKVKKKRNNGKEIFAELSSV